MKKIKKCINIDEYLWNDLVEIAVKEKRSASNMIERLIELYQLEKEVQNGKQ